MEGTGYYGFMTFEATPVYVEELGEEQYEWDRDSALYGVVDDAGNTVLPAQYEELSAVANGRLLVREGERQGVIDLAGEWLYQLDTARE